MVADDALDEDPDAGGREQVRADETIGQHERPGEHGRHSEREVPACGDQVDLSWAENAEIDARGVDELLCQAVPDVEDAVAVGVRLMANEDRRVYSMSSVLEAARAGCESSASPRLAGP